jgi:hypothetical protein
MIIQYPDGSYEHCPLPPAVVLWLRALPRRTRHVLAAACAGVAANLRAWAPGSGEAYATCDGRACS